MFESLLNLDQGILLWIQDFVRNDILSPIFIFITTLGNMGAIWILISVALLIPKSTRKIGILSLIALFASFIIDNVILKNVIGRARPFDMIGGLECMITKPMDYSFPSGHTASSFACATILFLKLPKKYGVMALILATLIGFSRLYLGVHYPTDVLAGAIMGIIIAVFVDLLYKNVYLKQE